MSIIATVIAFVILLIRKIITKRISPKCNFIIWTVFILALIFPISIPSKISIYNYVDVSDIKNIEIKNSNKVIRLLNESVDDLKVLPKLKTKKELNNTKTSKDYLMQIIIPDIWLIVCIVKLMGVIYSYRILTNGIGNDEVRDERIIKILERCKKKLKIKKKIKIIRQDLVKTPSILGLFSIKILFTDEMLELDNISINDVIMHELSHYKRKDNILNVLIMIMKSVYWFNPIIKMMFQYIKTDIELAADEMAISKMEKDEKREYCKIIVKIAGMCSSKVEQVLGITGGVKEIEERIDMIALKDKFEKHSIPILIFTISITLLMWFVLYPTSYGMFDVPKLYIKLENGDKIEASVMEEENNFSVNTIKVEENESVKLVTEGGRPEDYIYYDRINLNNTISNKHVGNIITDRIAYFETGEYIYKFTLSYGNNENIDYAIKIIVE